MIDVRQIREHPDALRLAVARRRVDPAKADVDRFLELDAQRRALQQEIDGLNTQKKELAQLGRTDPDAARARGQELREQGRDLETKLTEVSEQWQSILDWFPNWPHQDMPDGIGEQDNPEECVWIPGQGYLSADSLGTGEGSKAAMPASPVHADGEFEAVEHADLSPTLGIDTMQASKVSGSRFTYLKGDIARMQYAIQRLLCDELLNLFEELKGLMHDPTRFNQRLIRVDELRTRVQQDSRTYRIINAATQLAEFRRFSADRRINAAETDDVERAKSQIARDSEFITAVREGAIDVKGILLEALERVVPAAESS